MANAVVLSHKLSRIVDPSDIVWVQEDRYCWDIDFVRPEWNNPGASAPQYDEWCYQNGSYGQEYSNMHNTHGLGGARTGGGNVGYVDGHADYRVNGSLHPGDFGMVGIPGVSNSNDPNTINIWTPYYGAFDN